MRLLKEATEVAEERLLEAVWGEGGRAETKVRSVAGVEVGVEAGRVEAEAEAEAEAKGAKEAEAAGREPRAQQAEAEAGTDGSEAGAEKGGSGGGGGGKAGGGEGGGGSTALCTGEAVRWAPEVRLYGAGRGLGRGLSLLGRPFRDEADVEVALEAAKSMAHVLLDLYEAPGAVTELPPDLQFEARDDAGAGACDSGSAAGAASDTLGLDVHRIWQGVLGAPAAAAPSTPTATKTKREIWVLGFWPPAGVNNNIIGTHTGRTRGQTDKVDLALVARDAPAPPATV